MGFDLSLTEYMLRRYAAGSRAGSGAFGRTTSGIEGDLNVEPLVACGDCLVLRPALELRLLFEAIESLSIDTFEALREKKPIAGAIVLDAGCGCVLLSEALSQAEHQTTVQVEAVLLSEV